MSSAAARARPLRAPPVSRAPSQPRAAVPESKNSACHFYPEPRSVDGTLDFSIDPVFLAASGVDTDLHRDSSADTIFPTVGQRGNATQTAFRPRQVATAYTLDHNKGVNVVESPASVTPTRPESTDNTDQPTARSARRMVRHAAIAAAQASADLATAMDASADLTPAVHASADLTSAVHAPVNLTSAVHAPADLASAVHAPAGLTIATQASPAVPSTVCRSMGVLPPGEAGNASALSFSPYQMPSRPATPLRPTAPLRSATSLRSASSLAPAACQAMSHEG